MIQLFALLFLVSKTLAVSFDLTSDKNLHKDNSNNLKKSSVSLTTANRINATSDLVKWSGRREIQTDGSVLFDWVGVSATVTLDHSVTYLLVEINDNCPGGYAGGGSRWLVTITTADQYTSPPNHRVSTFYTSPYVSQYVMWTNQGGKCDPECTYAHNNTFTLTRITESRVSVCNGLGNLSVVSFISDGAFLPPPPPRSRMIEFVGDSISAGDLNDGATDGVLPGRCGNIAMNDDITYTSGAQLCLATTGLNCDPVYAAWGGIDLHDMSSLYKYTWGDGLGDLWSWSSQPNEPDAVVINLGTNDRPSPPAFYWQEMYVSFVQNVSASYRNPPIFFLAYGPMTNEYQPFVINITATLKQMGYNVSSLDLTLPHPMTGCFGHPSLADNIEIAAKAKPQVATVMGWN
jgi:hypothetical protein